MAHAHNVAKAFRDAGMKAKAVSGETPKRELARTLAGYERGEIDVLVNAQLLAEGWNSPRATVCMHLAPTASKRIYQQRVGRVTRRTPGKEAGIVVDFVHPATPNDDPVVTLHSLLDRDVYRGGAIVVGPVRRGRGRRLRVERRVVPVTSDETPPGAGVRARAVADRRRAPELGRAAGVGDAGRRPRGLEQLAPRQGDAPLRLHRRAAPACSWSPACAATATPSCACGRWARWAALRDPEAFDDAVEILGSWSRDERREGVKVLLQALTEKQIGRRDQAARWLWHLAEYSREVHEEYAVQRWPETKRLLGLLVNSAGAAHARNARRLVQASRKHDRRLSAALLAAALAHTPEAQQVLDGARMRMARKPSALARELLKNFPKGKRRRGGRRRRKKGGGEARARRWTCRPRRPSRRRTGPPSRGTRSPSPSDRGGDAARRRPRGRGERRAARTGPTRVAIRASPRNATRPDGARFSAAGGPRRRRG